MVFIGGYVHFLLRAVTSWNLAVTVRLPGNQWRLQEVIAPNQEIKHHKNCKLPFLHSNFCVNLSALVALVGNFQARCLQSRC